MRKAYKKLKEENGTLKNALSEIFNSEEITDKVVHKTSIKEILKEIDEEFYRLDGEVDIDIKKPNKTIQEFYEYKEKITTMQTLSWIKGKLEELLN